MWVGSHDSPDEEGPVRVDDRDPTLVQRVVDTVEDSRIGIEALKRDLGEFQTLALLQSESAPKGKEGGGGGFGHARRSVDPCMRKNESGRDRRTK
jgi:hypothetical protein